VYLCVCVYARVCVHVRARVAGGLNNVHAWCPCKPIHVQTCGTSTWFLEHGAQVLAALMQYKVRDFNREFSGGEGPLQMQMWSGVSGGVLPVVAAGKSGGRLALWIGSCLREGSALQTLQEPQLGQLYSRQYAHGAKAVTGVRACTGPSGPGTDAACQIWLYSCGMDGRVKLWNPSRSGPGLNQARGPA
jgi:hypothetical protein